MAARKDMGLRECPNKYRYNANKHGDICPNCGDIWQYGNLKRK